jgi:hypothetical protein
VVGGDGSIKISGPQMNVVEKDALLVERDESAPQDSSGLRKAVTRSASPTSSKVNRLPALRERNLQPRFDVKRIMSDSSRDLRGFVAPLEEQVRSCFKYRSHKHRGSARAQAKVAELVLEVIRQLAFKETGVFNLEAPVPQLLSALFAGSVEVGIVTGLARRAHKALILRDAQERTAMDAMGVKSSRGLSYDVSRELDELVMLLKWYVRRKMSLCALELEVNDGFSLLDSHESPPGDEHDVLFGLEVMHDHQVFGVKGCLLTCGLRLLGRDGEALWLRVSLLSAGKPVAARSEWSSWTDPGEGAAVEILAEHAPFCSLVPIRPNSQRLVIDEVRAFVPYAALQLPPGRSEVEIVVAVIDGEGREVLCVSRPESICVPNRQLSLSPVPAPHAVGMWPHDVVSGDKISELTVTSGFKLVAGWERHSLSVAFDLSLFMHAGESVTLECRFVNSQGGIVELSSLGMPFVASELNVAVESISSYRYRRVLHPKGAWALYQGLCIDIPVEFLLLDPGSHEITCELVVVSADDRVLCGDMSRVLVHVPDRETRRDAAGEANNMERRVTTTQRTDSGVSIDLDSFEIDPSWQFGGDDCIRVQARFIPRNQSKQLADLAAGRVGELYSPYRVEISLEREDGHVLLQAYSDPLGMSFKPVTRAVCVDPYSGHVDNAVVANFKREEVLGWSLGQEGSRVGAKWRIFARVTAFSLAGEVLVSESKECFVKPPVDGGKQVIQVREPAPTLVDAVAYANAQGERLTSRVLVNLPAGEREDDGVRVQFVLCSPGGKREAIATKDLQLQHRGVWTRQVAGLCQYAAECEYQLRDFTGGEGYFIEASLLTRGGEVLHSIQQPVKVAGVLSELDENAADFDSDLATADPSSDAPYGFTPDSPNGSHTKGLWGRLFGRS